MSEAISLDIFNLIQITGISLALVFAIGLERSNRKLHADNQRRSIEDALDMEPRAEPAPVVDNATR